MYYFNLWNKRRHGIFSATTDFIILFGFNLKIWISALLYEQCSILRYIQKNMTVFALNVSNKENYNRFIKINVRQNIRSIKVFQFYRSFNFSFEVSVPKKASYLWILTDNNLHRSGQCIMANICQTRDLEY